MTPEIERLAKEAELADDLGRPLPAYPRRLAKFRALIAEECAKLVDPDADHRKDARGYFGGKEGVELLDRVAKTVRAKFALSDLKDEAK